MAPAAAVLIGQLFTQYAYLAGEGRYARFWRRLRWPHLALLLAVSVGLPIVLHAQPLLIAPFAEAFSWPMALGFGAVLLGVAFLSLRWMLQDHPGQTLAAWAVWTIVFAERGGVSAGAGPGAIPPCPPRPGVWRS